MKTKKKVAKKVSTLKPTTNSVAGKTLNSPTEIPKTIREQLERDFFRLVLEIPFAPIPKDKTLLDFATEKDAKWAKEYVQLYMDNIYMRMNVQTDKTIRNKPVVEILDYLEKVKRGRIFHGWK